jgi:hypothetical protein
VSYLFDGVDDQIRTSIGGQNFNTAVTMVTLCKFAAGRDGAWNGLTTCMTSGGAGRGYGIDKTAANKVGFLNDGSAARVTTTTTTSADNWCLHVATKATGTVTPKYHRYKFDTTTWVTGENFDGTVANPTTPGGTGLVQLGGDSGGGDWFSGRLAVIAYWNSVLTDPQILTLISTFTRANWLSLTPTGLWDATDQFATDQTGNGATRTLLTGTTSDADDPTGWASWAGSVADIPYLAMAPPIPT